MSDKGITLHGNGEDFSVETAPGRFVPEIDPVTQQPTGRAQRFTLANPSPDRPLSATEREAQRIAYIAAVDALTAVQRETVKAVDGLLVRTAHIVYQPNTDTWRSVDEKVLALRVDTLERLIAARYVAWTERTFWQRIGWLVTGR